MVLGTQQMLQRLPADFHVTLLEKEVTIAFSARDQGLQVESTLSFDEHITNTVSLCLGSLCQINRVRHFLGTRTLGNVINALVFGKLHYLLNLSSCSLHAILLFVFGFENLSIF